jgi:hypothetical protein
MFDAMPLRQKLFISLLHVVIVKTFSYFYSIVSDHCNRMTEQVF